MIKPLIYHPKVATRPPSTCTPTKAVKSSAVKEGITEGTAAQSSLACKSLPPRHCFVVRSIFQRVDYAFKRKKEENSALAMAVTDLENQLAHIETSTQDQIHSTASLNQTLSATRSSIDQAQQTCDSFEAADLESLRSVMVEFGSLIEQGTHGLLLRVYAF